uniref:Puratrophin-1-like n=1 Tax=Saccoglossus kowalevskii TaxID=10224 RepID=A0ABM0N0R4_SACKO|nr:PREDICTED: puratrophin-1-like [Saccoglossus kowalevskii]
MASREESSKEKREEKTCPEDSQEAFDNSVQETLSRLFPPFRSTAPIIIGQVCQIVDNQYDGDGRTFFTDYLLPAKVQLQVLREEAKLQLQITFGGNRKPKDEGWPICYEDRIIVHLGEISEELLQSGDFYFQLKSPVPGTILLALTYVYHGRIHSILIPQDSYEILFTMEWLHSVNPGENRMVLEHCVVSKESGIERMNWEEIIRPPFAEKKSRKKSGKQEQRKSSSRSSPSASSPTSLSSQKTIIDSSSSSSDSQRTLMDSQRFSHSELTRVEEIEKLGIRSPDQVEPIFGANSTTATAGIDLTDSAYTPNNGGCGGGNNGAPKPLQMLEVNFEVLHSGAAVLTGARDSRGGAVLEIYTNNHIWRLLECCSEEITKVFMYYYGIPREQIQQRGLSVIVDARGASTSVLEVLVDSLYLLQNNRSGAINTVYVLLEAKSPLLYLNSTLFKPQVNFKFELLSSVEALNKFIPCHQVTSEFSGTYPYNHEDWIRFRMNVEPFMAGCRGAAKFIISITKEVANIEKPESAQDTIYLIEKLERKIRGVYEDSRLVGLQSEGDAILTRLRNEHTLLAQAEDFRDSLQSVTMLYNQIHEVVTTLDGLAATKHSQLEQHLQLKLFEEESAKIATWVCNDGESFLNRTVVVGESLSSIKATQRDFEEFYFEAMKHISQGEDLLEEASMLVQSGHYESTGIKDQAKTLKQHLRSFIKNVEDRRELVEDMLTLYTNLTQASDWAQLSMKYLVVLDMDGCVSREDCQQLRKKLEQHLRQHPVITEEQFLKMRKLADKHNYAKCLDVINEVQERCRDTEQLVNRKIKSLERLKEQLRLDKVKKKLCDEYRELDMRDRVRPDQRTPKGENMRRHTTAKSEGASPKSVCSDSRHKYRDSSLGSSASEDSGISENNRTTPKKTQRRSSESNVKSNSSTPDHSVLRRIVKGRSSVSPRHTVSATPSGKYQDIDMRSDGTGDNDGLSDLENDDAFPSELQNDWTPGDVNSHLHKSESLPSSIRLDSGLNLTEEERKRRKKMTHIMGELLQTERDYVRALDYIKKNYFPEMEREDIPQPLRGQRGIVFGNIEKIYDFHYRYFLHELEECRSAPLLICHCFLKYKKELNLYALYNKNKPKSDALLAEYGSFFKSKQKELGDKMDLASYLLKPTQRMGKYALLLKDLIKESPETEPELQDLKAAEDIVKFQLRHGNDLLAMDSIKDCDVNVKEQGQLLRQDEFLVYHGRKKYLRHVFLFEDLVLFSKTKKTNKGHDIYHYKNCIKTADVGLTENIGESGLKFELWFRKRKAQETYIFHAPTYRIKHSWTDNITKILWKQAFRSKECRMAEMHTMGIGQKPCIDIKPSKDQINDRAIDYVMKGRGSRSRNSVAECSFDHSTPTNKRPLSIISVSSSSSTGSGSSIVGSLALANFDTLLSTAELPEEFIETKHRHSLGTVHSISGNTNSCSEV